MPKTDNTIEPIDTTFRAIVTADSKSGWACVQMPESAKFFGTGKSVKVGGTIAGEAYEATMLPVGGGTHMLPLRAAIRRTLGLNLGNEVTVHLTRRLA